MGVTVVIPTRNRPQVLAAHAVRAALLQTTPPVEILVIDDGSEHPTGLSHTDDRVRVHRMTRRGVAAARNAGLRMATGEWIAFLDDDDAWHPGKLVEQLETARRARADFVYSSAALLDVVFGRIAQLPAPQSQGLSTALLQENVIPAGASNVLVRRELLTATGPFDEELRHLSDWDMWIRLAQLGRGARCPEIHVAYVLHDLNTAAFHLRRIMAEVSLVRTRYTSPTVQLADPRPSFLEWIADAVARSGRPGRAAALTAYAGWLDRDPKRAARVLRRLLPAGAQGRLDRARSDPPALPWLASYPQLSERAVG